MEGYLVGVAIGHGGLPGGVAIGHGGLPGGSCYRSWRATWLELL